WWQVLPLGPTGHGDSPYSSPSSFTGNPILISPDRLIEDGLLQASVGAGCSFPAIAVDYEAVIPLKFRCPPRSCNNFRAGARADLHPAFEQFRATFAPVLDDFALFMALKIRHGGASFQEWPDDVRRREPAALAAARVELAELIDQQCFFQFLASR